uniref:Uncharacterized protein n=1 Tax=Scytodes thoracica TaxID=1112478 RepID=A0A0A0V9J6_SCYTH|nr:hypothetical protein [Scytodes thoracica]
MDTADHENIPNSNLKSFYSKIIRSGIDYLNLENLQWKLCKQDYPSVKGKASSDSPVKCKPFGGWFYKNVIPEQEKPPDNMQGYQTKDKNILHSTHKKCVLSNFDLNALSPTSW